VFKINDFETFTMTTELERNALYELSKNLELKDDDCLLEFGVYFGGSLEAIAEGLKKNKYYNDNMIIGVDAFSTIDGEEFSKIVTKDAKANKLYDLLEKNNNKLNWIKIPESKLAHHKNLKLIQTKIEKYSHKYGNIALVHFDLPKYYDDMYCIMKECLENFQQGTLFIFQDFFYHWSAETIAFIYYLIKNDIVEFVYGVSSSLICKNVNLELKNLDEFKQLLENPEAILNLLDECHTYLKEKNFCGARVIFAEEFYLAAIQYSTQYNDKKMKSKYETIFEAIKTSYGNQMYSELEKYNFNGKKSFKGEVQI